MARKSDITLQIPEAYEAYETIEDVKADLNEDEIVEAVKRYFRTAEANKRYRDRNYTKTKEMKATYETILKLAKEKGIDLT